MNMTKTLFFCFALLFLSALNVFSSEILTNESVLKMVQAGLETDIIISKIKTSQNQFDTSVDEILRLKKEGVAGEIIKAMMIGPDNNSSNKKEDDYQHALNLLQEDKYDDTIAILTGLAVNNVDPKYHFPLIEALLAKSEIMKESGDSGWESVAKSAQERIKGLLSLNSTNADYWILYAKFSSLVGSERGTNNAIQKYFFYLIKSDNEKEFLFQGNNYFQSAISLQERADSSGFEKEIKNMGIKARNAYKSALDIKDLSNEIKSEVYFMLGYLEEQIFRDWFEADKFWKQAISIAPKSKWAMFAQIRLNKYK